VASTLTEHNETLGHYATELAEWLQSFNEQIKTKSLDELASDAKRLAKDNPALFILGAVTIGAIGARFFRASDTTNSQMSDSPSLHGYAADEQSLAGQSIGNTTENKSNQTVGASHL